MAERPSTSDGSKARGCGDNQFIFDDRAFSKRVSRDDSFLNTKPQIGMDFGSYERPRARRVPSDLSSQRKPTPGTLTVPTISMPTVEESGAIGMALGSPGQAAHWHTWDSSPAQKTQRAVSPAPSRLNGAKPSETPAPKKQPGKWKLFGMFGRKHSDPTSNTSVPAAESNKPRGSEVKAEMPQSRPTAKLERSQTSASRKTPKHKPLMVGTNILPYAEDVAVGHQLPKLKPARQEDDRALGSGSSVERDALPPAKGSEAKGLVSKGPLLNVEIPTIEMERYSVMFSSVLDRPSSSSLLARRQATLQQLKSLDDAREQEQGAKYTEKFRRASSPQPTGNTPMVDQFPTPPSSQGFHNVPHRLSPHAKGSLTRSNTSPAMLHSPLRHKFEPEQPSPVDGKPSSYNHLRDPAHGSPQAKLTIATLAKDRGQQLSAPKSHRFDPEVSSLILESPTGSHSGDDGESGVEGGRSPESIQRSSSSLLRAQAQRAPEPKWEMVDHPSSSVSSQQAPSTASSSTSSRKGFASSSSASSSAETNPTPPSSQSSVHDDIIDPSPAAAAAEPEKDRSDKDKDQHDDEDDDDMIIITKDMNPVDASIARQISLSRQQRRLLRPLHTTGRSNSRTGTAAAASAAKMNGGKQQQQQQQQSPVQLNLMPKIAMAETRSSTPTLVVPRAQLDPQLPQHRKSERIVLEEAA